MLHYRKPHQVFDVEHRDVVEDLRKLGYKPAPPIGGGPSLYLRLSMILGILALDGNWKYWPVVTTTLLSAANIGSLIHLVLTEWERWMSNDSGFFSQVIFLFISLNLNLFLVTHTAITVKNSSKLTRLLSAFDETHSMPKIIAIFEIVFTAASLANYTFFLYSRVTKLIFGVMRCILTCLAMLAFIQYAAFIEHFSSEISLLVNNLKTKIATTTVCVRQYFELLSAIDDVNQVYRKQLLLLLTEVFCTSVASGYVLLAVSNKSYVIGASCSLISEAGVLIYVTMTCHNAMNKDSAQDEEIASIQWLSSLLTFQASTVHILKEKPQHLGLIMFHYYYNRIEDLLTTLTAHAFNSQLFRALRNRPDLQRDTKLELIVKVNTVPIFAAGGFIEISNGLITSMVAAVATYLVMMLQLQSSDLEDA